VESEGKKEKELPLVSVIMLSYNHRNFISKAIDSVFMQVNDYKNIELIVLDDGSDDGTLNILLDKQKKSPIPFKLIKNQHEGVRAIARNLNKLIKMAQGKYIAFLASDDEYVPNRFLKQVKLLEQHEKLQIVFGNGLNIQNGIKIGKVNDDSIVELIQMSKPKDILEYITENTSPLYLQSCLVRKKFLDTFIPYDEDLIADDWVFCIRAFTEIVKHNYIFLYLNEIFFYRNIHKTNTSTNDYVQYKRISQVIDKYTPQHKRANFHKRILKMYLFKSIKTMNLSKLLFFGGKYLKFKLKRTK